MTDSTVKSNWYERATDFVVGIFSPTRVGIRQYFRRLDRDPDYREAVGLALRLRGYKSASHSPNHTPWASSSPRSADAEINPDLWTMRNRSRAANRDDALTSGITRALVRGVVGTGLRPKACTGDEAKDRALEAVWGIRAPQLDQGNGYLIHGAHQRLVYGKRIEDGDVFLRPAVTNPGEPIWIEVIEADRVRTPADAYPVDDKGRIINGVEKDGFGRVLAYWVLQRHPGDWVLWDTKMGKHAHPFPSVWSKKFFDRVDAASVCHVRGLVARPGQSRGVPLFHAVMQDLRDLDLLMLAALKRTQVAACLAAFITSPLSTPDLLQMTAEDFGYQLYDKIEPGMMFRLFPGEEVQFLNPVAGVPNLDSFVMLLARRIGSSIGLSPQCILRWWDGTSYSGARTIKIDDGVTFKVERSDFGGHALSWEWRVVMEDELLRGNEILAQVGVEFSDLRHVEWIGDEERWVDPQAESASVKAMLEMGLTSHQIECVKLGRDAAAVLRDNIEYEVLSGRMRREAGLGQSSAGVDVGMVTTPPTSSPAEIPAGDFNPPLKLVPPAPEDGFEFDDLGAGKPLDVATYGQPGKGAVA